MRLLKKVESLDRKRRLRKRDNLGKSARKRLFSLVLVIYSCYIVVYGKKFFSI